MAMDAAKYRDLFVSETREHLVNLNRALLALEKSPGDAALLDEVFRSMHTIKGMAASIGQDLVAELTHQAESLLDRMRKRQAPVGPAQIDLMLEALDFLEAAVAAIARDQSPDRGMAEQAGEIARKMEALASAGPQPEPASSTAGGCDFDRINPLKVSGDAVYKIRVLLEQDVPLKSARAFLVLHNLELLGKVAYTVPERHDLEAERFDRGFSVFLVSRPVEIRSLEQAIACSEIEDIQIEEVREESAEEAIERKTVGAFLQLAQERPRDIKVSVQRLDALMNLVGEMLVWKDRLKQLVSGVDDPAVHDGVDRIAKITSDLQHQVLTARLVPMSEIFDRFPRVVRDAAKALSKEIDFRVEGRELEMDRSILQMLAEPLVHLLRNAVDHGVETPERRAAAGKPQAGTIRLAAAKLKDQVVITVEDDGRGLDLEAIRRKAVERGLAAPEKAASLSEAQLADFIAMPGFSTAEKVTEVSGRGVGLDVVKNKVEAMGGSLRIESRHGAGTTFLVTVPLSLAIIRTLLVAVEGDSYSIPMSQVRETVEVKADDVRTLQGRPLFLFRRKAIPLAHLGRALGRTGGEPRMSGPAVVVERQGGEAALLIDRMLGQQEIVIKPLSALVKQVRTFSGATIGRDGRPMLILDVNNLALK
jgi:two-component system chemotaxis sensor kinase CheA